MLCSEWILFKKLYSKISAYYETEYVGDAEIDSISPDVIKG